MIRADLTTVDALTILLTTQSLLLTAFGIVVVMGTPGQRRPPNLLGGAAFVGAVAVLTQLVVGAGSGFAWSDQFLTKWPHHLAGRFVAISILVAIIGEALLATLLGWALRRRKPDAAELN